MVNIDSPNPNPDPNSASVPMPDPVIPQDSKIPQTFKVPEANPTNKKLPIIILLFVVVILTIGAGAWYYLNTPSYKATQVLKTYLSNLEEENYESAYKASTVGFQESATQEELQKYSENMGLSSLDIPKKIVYKRVYTKDRDLSEQGEFTVELKGQVGDVQTMIFYMTTERGKWKVRLIEVDGDTTAYSKIGRSYDDPIAKTEANNNVPPSPTQIPSTNTTETDNSGMLSWSEFSNKYSSLNYDSSQGIVPVTKVEIQRAAKLAVSTHFWDLRFNRVDQAIEQLSPAFKAKVTPVSYIAFMSSLGINNVVEVSFDVVAVDVRTVNGKLLAKVRATFKDFNSNTPGGKVEKLELNVGLYSETGKGMPYKDWKIISFFKDSSQSEYFPY